MESRLDAGGLKAAYNPVLLDYLLEEGADDLPDDQRKQATDQLVTALKALYEKAADGIEPETGRAVAAFLAGTGNEFLSDRDAKQARLVRLRRQIADALATIDHADSGPVLAQMLDDSEPSVRTATAQALGRMSDASALPALAKAMTVDYGNIGEGSRNPTVLAYVARQAARSFPGESGTAEFLGAATASKYASGEFLGLCASD